MSTNSKESTERLKGIIKGKSKLSGQERQSSGDRTKLKRRIEELSMSIQLKKMRLKQMKEIRSLTESHPIDVQQEQQDSTASTKSFIELPPAPRAQPVLKPKTRAKVDLPQVVATLLKTTSTLSKPQLCFEVSDEAAAFNMRILRENKFDLEKILNSHPSVTSYGSEFKSVEELEPLLQYHPRWKDLKTKLTEGAAFPVKAIDDDIRLQDLEEMKKRGNHKSAKIHEDHLASAFQKEIEKGWIFILPDEEATNIPGLELAPMGVAEQLGVSATGDFVSKLRITHDLSFPQKISGESINSRVNEELLEPCMFGHTLL
jgi:hypothetical protein